MMCWWLIRRTLGVQIGEVSDFGQTPALEADKIIGLAVPCDI